MSDPSALQIPVHQALTSDMLLGLKPSAPKSRSYRISIAPINKSVFNPGDQIIFEFPTGRKGTWLDQSQSYLKFSVQFSATAAVAVGGSGIYLDNSAYSFIQRMDIYNSSNLLETINEYGQLANFLIDKAGLSTLIGTNPTNATYLNMTSTAAILAGAATTFVGATTQPQVAGDRSGLSCAAVAVAGGIGTAIPYTFSLPLLSGIIGINASKMLPVGKLHAPIRVEMYLAANDDAIYYGLPAAGALWQILNVEFCACYVEIQDDSLDTNPAPGEQEYISTTTYRQASTYMPAATSGEFTTLLPFRAASITALYARFRPFGTAIQGANGTAAYRKGASINPNLSFYYFRIGSSIYPNKPVYLTNGSLVGTGAEAYGELLKSFHALSSTIGNTALTHNSYNVAATATQGFALNYVPGSKSLAATTVAVAGVVPPIDTHGNAFAIGLECQSFSNRNDTILSGISTLNSQIYFTGGIANGLTAGGVANNYNYTIDFFSQMDMVLVMQDGILSAKF